MTTTKRGHAINGDLFTLRHHPRHGAALAFDVPFTTFVDVSFRGTDHQVFAAADRGAFNYANATGEFTVGDHRGYVLEMLDHVETQVSHRYQAVVETGSGVLSTHSYDSVEHLLSLVGSLRPRPTPLGVRLDPDDEIEYTSPPRVALHLAIGVVELTPLTAEVIEQLPGWAGSPVGGGELYGGRLTDTAAYVTLVTPTCRLIALPGADADEDAVTRVLTGLEATWNT